MSLRSMIEYKRNALIELVAEIHRRHKRMGLKGLPAPVRDLCKAHEAHGQTLLSMLILLDAEGEDSLFSLWKARRRLRREAGASDRAERFTASSPMRHPDDA